MEEKPFIFGVPTSGDNFTDREKETARLLMNFQYGINTILISPRRWGKTSLIQKVRRMSQSEKLKVVYMEIFSCHTEKDFYGVFLESVLKQTASKFEEWFENVKTFLSRISPKLSFGSDPMNEFSVSLEFAPKPNDIEEILQLPEKIAQEKGYKIVICIDEFQQIGEFRDSVTFQKRLRGVWQLQERVSYCLFGSKKHLMNELFERKSLPFYKFGDVIFLKKIPTENWVGYICERFQSYGKGISVDLAEKICKTVDNHSSYVQQYAWLVWIRTKGEATQEDLDEAFQDIIDQNTPLFERLTENLSTYQLNFLRAVLSGVHKEFSSTEVIRKYDLGSSANVTTIRNALIKKELVEIENREITIADPLLEEWLRRELARRWE